MKVTDFDYDLPEELIAQHPVEPRDTSRLLTLDKITGEYTHKAHFYDLLDELQVGDVLVFNNTKVIPARLYGQREGSGGKVEVLLLTPCGEDRWECLVKPGKKCPIGQVIVFDDRLKATVLDKTDFGGRIVEFTCDGVFDDIIQEIAILIGEDLDCCREVINFLIDNKRATLLNDNEILYIHDFEKYTGAEEQKVRMQRSRIRKKQQEQNSLLS